MGLHSHKIWQTSTWEARIPPLDFKPQYNFFFLLLHFLTHIYSIDLINHFWLHPSTTYIRLPQCLSGKESACSAGDTGSIPGLGRSPGGVHGNPLQDSCWENPMDRGDWQATVQRVAKSQTWVKLLSMSTTCIYYGRVREYQNNTDWK